jgi:hypothetical protein
MHSLEVRSKVSEGRVGREEPSTQELVFSLQLAANGGGQPAEHLRQAKIATTYY